MNRLHDRRGFTIIEVMAATFIIAVAFLGLATVHVTASKAHSVGLNRGTAAMLATQEIETMRRNELAAIQSGSSSANLAGVAYSVTRSVTAVPLGRKVAVVVTWTDRFGPQTLSTQSVVSQVTNP